MYELIWQGSRFQIIPSKRVPKRSGATKSSPLILSAHTLDLKTWKDYVLQGLCADGIRDVILRSWSRCRENGVDPSQGKCRDIRSDAELGEAFRFLRDITLDMQMEIYELIRDRGLLVTISEERGYLLGMFGDVKALTAADRLNFGPGANWSEASVGTNAIGTALQCCHPLQVKGREHFCESHHGWICSAAPIFGWDGKPVAVLDISGPMDSDHRQALELALHGARHIESRLYRIEAAQQMFRAFNLVQKLFGATSAGLVLVDPEGRILEGNNAAADLLGIPPGQWRGAKAELWFDLPRSFKAFAKNIAEPEKRVRAVRCHTNPALPVFAHAMSSPNGTVMGFLLILQEPHFSPKGSSSSRSTKDPFQKVLGRSRAICRAVDVARRVARTDTTVLLVGESGTGKEVLARAIHEASRRKAGPFVAVNCGAIPSGLIQSVLFGYEEGAFTGARRGGSRGLFESADSGTLFLDEIAEMPLDMQVNLLRVLEDGQVTRVGGNKPIKVDVRIIAATHRDLAQRVADGLFREDLFYRLQVVRIALPPLRERKEDLELLVQHFLTLYSKTLARRVRAVLPDFYDALHRYHWPGNVRELRHAIEAAVALMPNDVLSADCLPEAIVQKDGPAPGSCDHLDFNLRRREAESIRQAYAHFQGNISQAARALGIGRNTLYAKLKKLNLL
ncbi:sigma-54-dependent Fis family transcriptional regulator [Desulfosoma caldarium]|uniref:Transcriptional regulator of acetoin/glycerol metabolism n=1 Tax=Desulfosoma caldarium TaxID=610254 RepID=A0A3N1UMH2_9BACT|nr:sigma-54-dependent Fis family transcriptional regulator [Desulfosoma caldarium]ROQ90938.1 transcriptional regulator of acetoin/glycerol metabolism [Desulfosoma caldarium]